MKSAFMFPIYLTLTKLYIERKLGSKSEKRRGQLKGPTRNQRGRTNSQ